jgi:hypothetical protein
MSIRSAEATSARANVSDVLDRSLATHIPPAPSLAPSSAGSDIRRALPVYLLLGALLLGAAAVHLAIAPSNFRESTLLGAAALGSAGLQIGLAGAVVAFPTRWVLRATALTSLALIVVWAVSRTAGHAEAVTFADGVTVALEAVAAVLAALVVARWSNQVTARAPAVIAAFGALAVATAAIASPAVHDQTGVSHAVKTQDLATASQFDQPLDPGTHASLEQQLIEARAFATRFPTASDATANGYQLGGGFAPGKGATYISASGASGGFDPGRPEALIYDGTAATSQVIGLVYFAVRDQLPEGFAGPNDHWQRHSDVCVKFGPGGVQPLFPADADVTAAQCASVQGNFLGTVGWTVHAWVVPSWENPGGVFAADNPHVRCADGTHHADPAGYCQGN